MSSEITLTRKGTSVLPTTTSAHERTTILSWLNMVVSTQWYFLDAQ